MKLTIAAALSQYFSFYAQLLFSHKHKGVHAPSLNTDDNVRKKRMTITFAWVEKLREKESEGNSAKVDPCSVRRAHGHQDASESA